MGAPKDRTMPLEPWTCPKCKRTLMLPKNNCRKLCPECRIEERKNYYKKWDKAQKAEKKQQAGQTPEGASKPAKPKKQPAVLTLDQRIELQIKLQCKKCDWYRCGESGVNPCCIYYLRHGVGNRVDHGNGPGDCRMFLPKGARLRKTKIEDGKQQLAQSEADFMGSKPRKEDKENATR